MHQRPGEAIKDRDRRVAGVIFRDSIGKYSNILSLPCITRIDCIDTAQFLPIYSKPKIHLPWKHWVELAAKEELCIVGWVDGIIPPGSDFDIKKLGAGELRKIVGSYIDHVLNGDNTYEAFSVIRWSEGA